MGGGVRCGANDHGELAFYSYSSVTHQPPVSCLPSVRLLKLRLVTGDTVRAQGHSISLRQSCL